MEEKTKIERKNNKSVKTAVLLFGAVLITMSLLGGTLAKYTSEIGKASDSARVAKWYVSEKVSDFDLFADSYLDEGAGNTKGAWDADNKTNKKNTVQGDTEGTKVIAPGTKGSATIQIDANSVKESEVAFKYVFELEGQDSWYSLPFYRNGSIHIDMNTGVTQNMGWNVLYDGTSKYNGWLPLRFKITKGSSVVYDGLSGGAQQYEDGQKQVVALRNELGKLGTDVIYPKSTSAEIQNIVDDSEITIEWEWPFKQVDDPGLSADDNKLKHDREDGYDTLVGQNAASTDPTKVPNFKIPISVKKVQVD